MVDEEHPASTVEDLELETRKAEASYLPEWQTGRDGDGRRRCKPPRTPMAEGTIPWEEPGLGN